MINEAPCTVCKGSGRQSFYGLADTHRAQCSFCGGHGTRAEELKWFDKTFSERGLTDAPRNNP